MRESYLLAYRLGCKDVTVFRDTSIKGQVLVAPRKKHESSQGEEKPEKEQYPTPPKLLAVPLVGGSQGVGEQLKSAHNAQAKSCIRKGATLLPRMRMGRCAPKHLIFQTSTFPTLHLIPKQLLYQQVSLDKSLLRVVDRSG